MINYVKFRSWKLRTTFYKARQRNHSDQQKKPDSSFNVSLDLTKPRYNLLIKAKGLIANNPSVAFSDINCSLVLKFNDNTYRYFNSESELKNILNPEFQRN